MTAYDILKTLNTDIDINESQYEKLISDFCNSFVINRNYEERLKLHRKPIEYLNGVLREVYGEFAKCQSQEGLRYVHYQGDVKVTGYVFTEVEDIRKADKRLAGFYDAIKVFCGKTGRNFTVTAVHLAEYKAFNLFMDKINRDLYHEKSVAVEIPVMKNQAPKKRKAIPQKMRRELQKEAGSICPFCGNDEVAIHEVHHIDEDRGNNAFTNLIHLCGNCHSKVTVGTISKDAVINKKQQLMAQRRVTPPSNARIDLRSKIANINTGDHTSITIEQNKNKVIQKYPPGCIGYDGTKGNYIQYLIDRYQEYKRWETGKDKMNYAIFYKQIKHHFKIGNRNILNLPGGRFDEISLWIQDRIDGTKLAKQKGKTHKNYSTFTEYIK